jgi:hypothetical protein
MVYALNVAASLDFINRTYPSLNFKMELQRFGSWFCSHLQVKNKYCVGSDDSG